MNKRLLWLLIVLAVVALAAWPILKGVDAFLRAPPNYSQIEDGLFMGGVVASPPPGTRAVLSLCEVGDKYKVDVHRSEPIPDAEPVPSLAWLRQQVEFIDAQRRAGLPVYVHCLNGVSRSGMVMSAYFMWKQGWTRDEALAFVRSRRPIVNPNPAFMDLLLAWEKAAKS